MAVAPSTRGRSCTDPNFGSVVQVWAVASPDAVRAIRVYIERSQSACRAPERGDRNEHPHTGARVGVVPRPLLVPRLEGRGQLRPGGDPELWKDPVQV